jgi:hypothetical protein
VSPIPAEIHQEDVAVVVRSRYWLAAALGLWMAYPLPAAEPARLEAAPKQIPCSRPLPANQQMADAIAGHLRQSAKLQRYQIEISFQDGRAELTGSVAGPAQREEVLRIVRGVRGVEQVSDRLTMASPGSVTPTQFVPPAPTPAGNGAGAQPLPIYQGAPSAHDLNPPRMPPYAWPTYAPYNNYSRVAYPQLYPYNSWPFIGPCHPFPKVPLGWRSVKLTWQDGYWWYSKTASGYDWWRLRYW